LGLPADVRRRLASLFGDRGGRAPGALGHGTGYRAGEFLRRFEHARIIQSRRAALAVTALTMRAALAAGRSTRIVHASITLGIGHDLCSFSWVQEVLHPLAATPWKPWRASWAANLLHAKGKLYANG